jgi:hypothetical protein
MASLVLRPAAAARSLIGLVTALAVMLPLPARCASCSTGGECPRCAAAKPDKESSRHVPGFCCQRRAAADDRLLTDVAVGVLQDDPSTCGCGVRPTHRTAPPAKELTLSPELIYAFAPTAFLPANPSANALAAAITLADLPPPIPHRILHCSWVI